MTLEELSQQLIAMAAKPSLNKADYAIIKKVMCSLKKSGMSNEDISVMSGGRWSASTVKGYTKGAQSSSESPWEGHAEIFKQMIEQGISVEDVKQILEYIAATGERGASIDDLLDLCFVCGQGEAELEDLLQTANEIKKSGLLVNEVAGGLNQIHELKKNGIGLGDLPTLVQTAANYGGMQAVIKGISAYVSLQEINSRVNTAAEKLEATRKEQGQLEKEKQKVMAELENKRKPLYALQKINKLGFGGQELNMLAVKTEKYGGVKKFMAGLDKFADYKAICHAAGEAEQELGKVKGAIKELYINYDNLKTAIEMCQHLIGEHNFSADNLNELMALAEKLGEPASIIGALNTYGSIASLEAAKAGLEEQTKQRNQLLNKIDAEYQHAMKLSAELQAEIDQVTLLVNEEKKTITESPAVQKLLRLMNNPTEADFKEHAAVVLPILVAIRTWAASHTKQIGDLETLGMDPIIWALGG